MAITEDLLWFTQWCLIFLDSEGYTKHCHQFTGQMTNLIIGVLTLRRLLEANYRFERDRAGQPFVILFAHHRQVNCPRNNHQHRLGEL